MRLFGPYWMNEPLTEFGRDLLVKRMDRESEKKLLKILQRTKSSEVRAEALSRIKNEDVLKAGIYNSEIDNWGKKKAIKKIQDQEFLKSVVNDSTLDFGIRANAVECINDVEFLTKTAFSHNDSGIRRWAAETADDAFKNDQNYDLQEIYYDLLKNAEGDFELPELEFNITEGITERDDLVKIIQHDLSEINRRDAFKAAKKQGLDDDPLLIDLANNIALHGLEKERYGAVLFTKDQKTLGEVALHDEDWMVREAAVKGLSDQKILAQVAVNDSDDRIKELALSKVENESYLERALKKHIHFLDYFDLYEKNSAGRMEKLAAFGVCRKCGEYFCREGMYKEMPFRDFKWTRTHIESFTDAERICLSCEETGDSYYGYVLK